MYQITPALGWNTWNTFMGDINEELVLRSADMLANSPLKKRDMNISSSMTAGASANATKTAVWWPIPKNSRTA